MPGYLPFAGKNAIAEMSIGIQFALPLDQRIGEVAESIKTGFALEFPKFEPMQTVTINFTNVGTPQPAFPVAGAPGVSGFSLSKPKEDGSVARALRGVGNLLTVHFLEYVSWANTKPQALEYIRRCLEMLAVLDRNPVTGVLVRYIDRFTFDGASQDAYGAQLFRPDNRFVALRVLDRGYQWHSNCGWFEPVMGTTSALNQLNVVSGMIQATIGVVVDHNSICTFRTSCNSVAGLMEGQGERPSLEQMLNLQHQANVNLLKNLLNQKMLDTIGLKG